MMLARIQAPARAARDEVVTVRLLIAHPMETGFRYKEDGSRVPYNVVDKLVCRYDGKTVFEATMSSGIAANPLLQFCVRATATADLVFEWRDESGEQGRLVHRLTVDA